MSDKKQLNEEQLEKVSGGENTENCGGIVGDNTQNDTTIKDCNNIVDNQDNDGAGGFSVGGVDTLSL